MPSSTDNLIRVNPVCLLDVFPRRRNEFVLLAQRIEEDGTLVFHPDVAGCKRYLEVFNGCAGPVPTEQARQAAELIDPKPPPPRPGFPAFTGYDGSARWAELHGEPNPSPATVERVIARVCRACQGRARALLKAMPPRFGSLEEYRRWTVEYHDAVNAEVGNPHFGWGAAVRKYGWPY